MKPLSNVTPDKQRNNDTVNERGSSGINKRSVSLSPATRNELHRPQDSNSSLVDDYADKSRIRIQELKRALNRRPSWRKKPRPMPAVFPGPDDGKPGNEVIYSNIAKYIENQRKKALAQQARVGSGENRGFSGQIGNYRRAWTPDFEAVGSPEHNRQFVNDTARPRSVNSPMRSGTPERYHRMRTLRVRNSVVSPGVSPVYNYQGMGNHAKSASLSTISDGKLIRSLKQSLGSTYNDDDDDSERACDPQTAGQCQGHGLYHYNDLDPKCSTGQPYSGLKHQSYLNHSQRSLPNLPRTHVNGRGSENSSVTSEITYDKFSKPLIGNDDDVSIGNSSIVSTGNNKALSSVDSENVSESCGRSVDSEVERYTRNIPNEGYSRYTRHSRGVSLDSSNSSYQSNYSNSEQCQAENNQMKYRPPIRELSAARNCLSYSAGQSSAPLHRRSNGSIAEPDKLLIRYNCRNNSPSVSDISSTRKSFHSSLKDSTLTSLDETSENLVNARIRSDMSSSPTRYPWQSSTQKLYENNNYRQSPSQYEKTSEVGALNYETRTSYLPVTGHRKRTPSEVKGKSLAQHARSFSSPVPMMEQIPTTCGQRKQHGQNVRLMSVSSQRALARSPNKNDAHLNRLMSRIPSRRPNRPHSVAIVERPSSRHSDGITRRSPYLWDCPLSRESRQHRLSNGESYGRTICIQGTKRPSSTGVFSYESANDNSDFCSEVFDSESGDKDRFGLKLSMYGEISDLNKERKEETEVLSVGLVRPRSRDDRYRYSPGESSHYTSPENKSSQDSMALKSTSYKRTKPDSGQVVNSGFGGNTKRSFGNKTNRARHSSQSGNLNSQSAPENQIELKTSGGLTTVPNVVNGNEIDNKAKDSDDSDDDESIGDHGPNRELATHVARLFKEQNQNTRNCKITKDKNENKDVDDDVKEEDDEENLDISRDKSIEEIEQMVRELEQTDQQKEEVWQPETPEEPETDVELHKTDKPSSGLKLDEPDPKSEAVTSNVTVIYVSKYIRSLMRCNNF